MKEAFLASLEWRFYAFIITTLVLLAFGHGPGEATITSVVLQTVLFFFHFLWLRHKLDKASRGE